MGAVIIMAALGLAIGVGLAVAARKFHVEVDDRVVRLTEALPGANCGGCGFAGCAGYAEALVRDGIDCGLCGPGGPAAAAKIAEILGRAAPCMAERPVAVMRCGKQGVATVADYRSVPTCQGASVRGLSGGPSSCLFGCLGFGDCVAVCPVGALSRGGEGEPIVVDRARCIACRKCELACPRNLFAVGPETHTVWVACRNHDKGADANKICRRSCIACGKCVKACPADAIHVTGFLAEIDQEKCTRCGQCVAACPKKAIVVFGNDT